MTGEPVVVTVQLQRDMDDDEDLSPAAIGKVVCPRYPYDKVEGWWLVVGNLHSNSLLSIKRVTLGRNLTVMP